MKHITLIIWILTSGTLAAQQTSVQDSASPLGVILDSTQVPIEMYDSTTFVNWPGTPLLLQYLAVDKEPIPMEISEFSRCLGFPILYWDAGISGMYVFKLLIDEEGSVLRIVGVRGYEPWLLSLEECVNQLRWIPAEKNGQPVMCWATLAGHICFSR